MRRELLLLAAALFLTLAAGAQSVETLSVSEEPDGFYSKTLGSYLIQGNVKDGLKEGAWYEFYLDKTLIHRVIQYQKGKKDGLYMEIDETGNLTKKSEYSDDKLNGTTFSWYRGGRLASKNTYRDDVLEGEQIKCYEQGGNQEVSEYKDGLRDGLTIWFDMDGNKVMTIEYNQGQFDGKQETFYKDGTLKTSKEFKDNVQDGPAYEYYESGALKSEATYKNGKLSGKVKTYADKPTNSVKPLKETDKEAKTMTLSKDTKAMDLQRVAKPNVTSDKKVVVKNP